MTTEDAIEHLRDIVASHKKGRKYAFTAKDREAIKTVLEHIAPTPAVEFDEQWEAFNKGSES